MTARDLARAVSSAWQEQLKFAVRTPLEHVGPKPRHEFGWLTLDPRGQLKRWGSTLPPGQVHLVTVPRSPASPHELWDRFARACSLDVPGLDLTDPTPNESLGVAAAELLRRVNQHLGEPFSDNREHARWLRDVLAHRVLVPLGSEPLGITDDQFERWSRRSEEAIDELDRAGYDVQGDLEDLRASRSPGRLPTDVPDAELLDTAVRTIVSLLTIVREQTMLASGEDLAGQSRPRAFARKLVRRAVAPVTNVEVDRLQRRVAELEAQVQANRALHQRVAELDDIVTELLLPARQGGNAAVRKAIARYRQDSV